MRKAKTAILVCLATNFLVARANDSTGPAIDLRVEQPAYAGLPVWIDVDVHDACLEARYLGDVTAGVASSWGFGPFNERAEVETAEGTKPGPGFSAHVLPHTRPPTERHACPGSPPIWPASGHRFPLHISANFRQAGEYRVRWVIPAEDSVDTLSVSPWLSFTITPSTPEQREAWLRDLLAHVPNDPDVIKKSYIPSLLAAWDDERVTRGLLDIMCSRDPRISELSYNVFVEPLGDDGQQYLSYLVQNGCLTPAFLNYLGEHSLTDSLLRKSLTGVGIARLQQVGLEDATRLIDMFLWLENGSEDALAASADAAILDFAPRIIQSAGLREKSELTDYLSYHGSSQRAHDVLRKLALQQGRGAESAMDVLVRLHDPADLPTVSARLTQSLNGLVIGNLLNIVRELSESGDPSPQFAVAAHLALNDISLHAKAPELRETAAKSLRDIGSRPKP